MGDMSFLGVSNPSSPSSGNVLNDLSSLISDIASTEESSATTGLNNGDNTTSAFQNNPQQSGDSFGSSQPNPLNALGLILEGLGELLQLLGENGGGRGIGTGPVGPGSGNYPPPNDPLFNSFQASDTGDPHLSFTGTEQGGSSNGKTVSKKWDDMSGHQDLLHADLGDGVFQLSSDVGTPINSNGVTLNKSAEVSYGDDSVSVNNQGNVTIDEDGTSFTLDKGQSLTLDSGLQVSNSQDGKNVTIGVDGPNGQNISTTISQGGTDAGQNYLNISASGNNVKLGGALVDGAAGTHTEGDATNAGTASNASSELQALEFDQLLQQENESNLSSILDQTGNQQSIASASTFDPDAGFTPFAQPDND